MRRLPPAYTPLSRVGSRRALDEAARITVRSNADYTSDTTRPVRGRSAVYGGGPSTEHTETTISVPSVVAVPNPRSMEYKRRL